MYVADITIYFLFRMATNTPIFTVRWYCRYNVNVSILRISLQNYIHFPYWMQAVCSKVIKITSAVKMKKKIFLKTTYRVMIMPNKTAPLDVLGKAFEWILANRLRELIYNNLPPFRYDFHPGQVLTQEP